MTNRELYQFVRQLRNKFEPQKSLSLEQYLSSLWAIVSVHQDTQLTIEKLVEWLDTAFRQTPPPFNSDWLDGQVNYPQDQATYEDWQNLILFQIADLHRMAEAGLLADPYRYYGLDSPSGVRWYNFDSFTYLECGIRGAFGGYVAEEVIVLISPPEGESADSPVYQIEQFTWTDFIEILECGQCYE